MNGTDKKLSASRTASRLCVYLALVAVLLFVAPSPALGQGTAPAIKGRVLAQVSGEPISYYNGAMRVDLVLVLDELRVIPGDAATSGQAAARAVAPGATVVSSDDLGGMCLRMPATGRAALEAAADTLSAAGYTVQAVAYPPHAAARDEQNRQVITSQLSLKTKGADIKDILQQHGLRLVEKVSYSPDTYVVEVSDGGLLASVDTANAIYKGGGVEFATPIIAKRAQLRLIPLDPLFPAQWHLQNTGQVPGTPGEDVNIVTAWDQVTGSGVNILITDDGLQETHPDLADNARTDLSHDYYQNDPDPAPGGFDYHGTAVAGIAAAKGNNSPTPIGVVGAGFDASLVGVRLVAGLFSDLQTANAMSHLIAPASPADNAHINSNSWGPVDSGDSLGTFGPLAKAAVENGIANGRGSLGIIYVWAAGNGRTWWDNVNYDGWASSRYSIGVGATGAGGVYSYYSEPGASMLVNAPSSYTSAGTTTTDIVGTNGYSTGDYTNTFGGTSSSAPLVSGIVALILERNPNLTWRDVQHILVDTAEKNDPGDGGWMTNGAGKQFNHNYGYGRIDATAAVNAAATWTNVPPEGFPMTASEAVPTAIPDATPSGITRSLDITSTHPFVIEHVEVTVDVTHTYRGDLQYVLTAPSGMKSTLATPRPMDSNSNLSNWMFTSVAHWGEDPNGPWTLQVSDMLADDIGTLNSWSITLHGTGGNRPPVLDPVGDKDTVAGETLAFYLSASDPDGDPIAYTARVVGQAYDSYINVPSSGLFSWSTTRDMVGEYQGTFVATDTVQPPLSDQETVTIVLGCPTPPTPTNVQASDGAFPDKIQITWDPVEEALDYRVYRSDVNDPTTAVLIGNWTQTTFDDYSVTPAPASGLSCPGLTPGFQPTTYYYWITARSACAESDLGSPDSGYVGQAAPLFGGMAPPVAFHRDMATDCALLACVALILFAVGRRRRPRACSS